MPGGRIDVQIGPVTLPSSAYPDATNTGIPAGSTLVPHSGDFTTTAPNQVVELLDMSAGGSINIAHPGCTVRYCLLDGWSVAGIYITTGALSGTPALIHHNTVRNPGTLNGSTAIWGDIGASNFEGHHNDIYGVENGYDVADGYIHDEFIHDLYNGGGDPHSDCIQTTTGGAIHDLRIEHCTLLSFGAGITGTSSIIMAKGSTSFTDVTVNDNVMAGGAYTIYGPQDSTGTRVAITNNKFWTLYKPLCGEFGWESDADDETLTGNELGAFSGGLVSNVITGTWSGAAVP